MPVILHSENDLEVKVNILTTYPKPSLRRKTADAKQSIAAGSSWDIGMATTVYLLEGR
jgi:hypothetical protein